MGAMLEGCGRGEATSSALESESGAAEQVAVIEQTRKEANRAMKKKRKQELRALGRKLRERQHSQLAAVAKLEARVKEMELGLSIHVNERVQTRVAAKGKAEKAKNQGKFATRRRTRRQETRKPVAIDRKQIVEGVKLPPSHEYLSLVPDSSTERMQLNWDSLPPSIDPGVDFSRVPFARFVARRERKIWQAESFALALRFILQRMEATQATVVDFGSGSGNLALPLAWWFPNFHFVLVDYKIRPLQIAEQRARQAGLTNVSTWQGRIEHYAPPPSFKIGLALHACGSASDHVQLSCMRRGAAYAMIPCCIGKIESKHEALLFGLHGAGEADTTAGGLKNVQLSQSGSSCSSFSSSVGQSHTATATAIATATAAAVPVSAPAPVTVVQRPRSAWLRAQISREEYCQLAQAADHSALDFDESCSDWKRLCKTVLEVDRNQAAQEEHGYHTELYKVLRAKETAKNDLLLGWPSQHSHPHLKDKKEEANQNKDAAASLSVSKSSVQWPSPIT